MNHVLGRIRSWNKIWHQIKEFKKKKNETKHQATIFVADISRKTIEQVSIALFELSSDLKQTKPDPHPDQTYLGQVILIKEGIQQTIGRSMMIENRNKNRLWSRTRPKKNQGVWTRTKKIFKSKIAEERKLGEEQNGKLSRNETKLEMSKSWQVYTNPNKTWSSNSDYWRI